MKTNSRYLFLLSYFLLLIGFYIGEDLNGSSKKDFFSQFHIITEFSKDYIYSFLNYNYFEGGISRQSPVFFFILSIPYKLNLSENLIRFINLNFCFVIILIFYKCIILIYPKISKIKLGLISIIISLSPSFRSLAIWPNSINLGLLFFVISIIFFINFKLEKEENKKFIFASLNVCSLAVSSYISPNFSVFSIYFFYNYLINLRNVRILQIVALNIILSMPALYYLSLFDNLFIFQNRVSPDIENNLNLSLIINKFSIILTIIFFHLSPFIILEKDNYISFKNNYLIKVFILIILFYFLLNYFNYPYHISGGGIFFKLSNFLFGNNYLFYLCFLISALFLFNLIYKNINNTLLIFCLLISNPQYSIYHKYFDPLVLILWFLLFEKNQNFNNYFNKNINIWFLYVFYFLFIILNYLKTKIV